MLRLGVRNRQLAAAVLIGLGMVIGGAEVSEIRAATMTQTATFNLTLIGGDNATIFNPSFSAFNSSLGTLTEVDLSLDSTVNLQPTTNAKLSAPLFIFEFVGPSAGQPAIMAPADFSEVFTSATVLAEYMTTPLIELALTTATCEPLFFCGSWIGDNSTGANETGVTLTYNFTPAPTPLPAALPLFATGLGALGLLGWRRKRKAQAVA